MPRRTAIGLDIGTSVVRAVELSFGRSGITLERFGQLVLPPDAVHDGQVVDSEAVAKAMRKLWSATKLTPQAGRARGREPAGDRAPAGAAVARPERARREPAVPGAGPAADAGRPGRPRLLPGRGAHRLERRPHPQGPAGRRRPRDRPRQRPGRRARPAWPSRESTSRRSRSCGRSGARRGQRSRPKPSSTSAPGSPTSSFTAGECRGSSASCSSAARTSPTPWPSSSGCPLAQAEVLKQQAGRVGTEEGLEDLIGSVSRTAQDFVTEIRGSLDYYAASNPNAPIERLVVTGGGSRLEGILDRLAAATRISVTAGDPMGSLRIGDTGLDDAQLQFVTPLAAVPVGLALGAIR